MDIPTLLSIAGASFLAGLILAGLISALFGKPKAKEPPPPAEAEAQPPPPGLQVTWDAPGQPARIYLEGKEIHERPGLGQAGQAWLEEGLKALEAWLTPPPSSPPPSVVASSQAETRPEVARVSLNPVESLVKALQTDVPARLPEKSIPAQVEEILQARVEDTPLAARGIHLADAPGGGVRIKVGLETYDGIEAVPDEEIKRALRAAVAEWTQKNVKK